MTYVINPWFFYLISIVDELKVFCSIIATLTGIVIGLIVIILGIIFIDSGYLNDNEKKILYFCKKIFIVFVISIILYIFIPSKTTLYQMIIAQNITYENIEKTKKEGIKLVDYIIEKTEEYNTTKDKD